LVSGKKKTRHPHKSEVIPNIMIGKVGSTTLSEIEFVEKLIKDTSSSTRVLPNDPTNGATVPPILANTEEDPTPTDLTTVGNISALYT
jgi:hypothetical protein